MSFIAFSMWRHSSASSVSPLLSQRFLRRLGDRFKAVLLQHLARDGMNLNFGYHVALPIFPWGTETTPSAGRMFPSAMLHRRKTGDVPNKPQCHPSSPLRLRRIEGR